MPCLPFDPSVYLESEDISQFAADVCERLRASDGLRPLLNRCVGNRWQEFEQGLANTMAGELFSEAPRVPELEWLLLPEAAQAVLEEGYGHILDSCLACFPLHAAATLIDLADNWAAALQSVARQPSPGRAIALAHLQQRIAAGAMTRTL